MGAYLRFWKQCFDFNGITSKNDYRVSFVLFLLFGSLLRFLEMLFLLFEFDLTADQASQGLLFTILD